MLDDLAGMALKNALGGGGNNQQQGQQSGGLAGGLLGALLGGGSRQREEQERLEREHEEQLRIEEQRLAQEERRLEQQRQQLTRQPQAKSSGGLFGSILDLLDGDGNEDEKLQKASELRERQLEEIERQQELLSQQQLQQLRLKEAEDLKAFRQQHSKAVDGNGILNHVLGDKRHSIEKSVSKAAGISEAQASQLAESLAPLLMGSIGKVQKEQNLDAQGLQSLLDNEIETIQKKAPPKSGGSLLDLLDADGDGDLSNDLLGLASKFLR